jgi:hypothetical protein
MTTTMTTTIAIAADGTMIGAAKTDAAKTNAGAATFAAVAGSGAAPGGLGDLGAPVPAALGVQEVRAAQISHFEAAQAAKVFVAGRGAETSAVAQMEDAAERTTRFAGAPDVAAEKRIRFVVVRPDGEGARTTPGEAGVDGAVAATTVRAVADAAEIEIATRAIKIAGMGALQRRRLRWFPVSAPIRTTPLPLWCPDSTASHWAARH